MDTEEAERHWDLEIGRSRKRKSRRRYRHVLAGRFRSAGRVASTDSDASSSGPGIRRRALRSRQ